MRLPGQNLYDGRNLAAMLARMPDTNNGSHAGGLGSVLMKALQGYQMGKERQTDEEARSVMRQAGEAMMGKPAVPDAPGPTMEGEAGYTIPGKAGDRGLAAKLLMGNERTAPMGYEMFSQDAARAAENEQFMQRFGMQNAAQDARFDKQLAASREDRQADREYRNQVRADEQAFRRDMLGMQASMRPPRAVQTVQTAEGVFTLNPDGSLGSRLGSMPVRGGAQQVIGQDELGNPIYGPQSKPMPPAALKLQQEELDAIGGASSISADMGAARKMIEEGKLQLGPWQNLVSKGQNFAGMSDENSRNFASFNATLEKARNDSLRLNKGVQTEGDAVRAWNELLSNINDPALVKQRLAEIEQINARGASLRKLNVDNIRQNYGLNPLDTSGYERVSPAIGGGGLSADEEAELAALRKRFVR